MNLKRLLGYGAVGASVAVAGSRLLRSDSGDHGPPLGQPQSTYRWRGFDVAYTEAGDPADPDLLILHGASATASSHEFGAVVDDLASEYHVLAPDLPGFGRSDRPPLLYSGSLYVRFLREFLADRTEEPTVVASSLSAAYAAVAASEGDLDVRRLVLICPTASTVGERRPWLRSLLRSPVAGESLYGALVSRPAIRYRLARQGFSGDGPPPERWVEGDWAAAHHPGGRFVAAAFLGGYLGLEVDLGDVLADVAVPVTVVWGRDAERPPLEAGRTLAERADARLVVFDDAAGLPHVEHPERFVELLD